MKRAVARGRGTQREVAGGGDRSPCPAGHVGSGSAACVRQTGEANIPTLLHSLLPASATLSSLLFPLWGQPPFIGNLLLHHQMTQSLHPATVEPVLLNPLSLLSSLHAV